MAVSGVIFRPMPCFSGRIIDTHSHSSTKSSFPGVLVNAGARISGDLRRMVRLGSRVYTKPKKNAGFWDSNDHIQYYSGSSSTVMCGCGKREKHKGCSGIAAKKMKKKLKFLRGLSSDLSMFSEMGFGLGSEDGSVDESKEKIISQAAEILVEQLQQPRAEDTEWKRKKKEEKSKLKTARMQNRLGVSSDSSSESSESSSDSSSESSDSECEEVVDISRLKNHSPAQPILNELQPVTQEATAEGRRFEVRDSQNHEQECCTRTSTSCSNEGSTRVSSKKVEVCMGGKCRKSGAAVLLGKFQRVLGAEGAVAGCKCMGKCRNGPNVRILNQADRVQAQGEEDFVRTPTNPLCIGVAPEDVDSILSKFFGETHD